MLPLVAALAVARSAYLDALGQGALPRDAASDIFDTLATFLRDGLRIVIGVAVLLALVSFLFGLPLGGLWARFVTDSRRGWFALHRNALLLVVAGAGGIALLVRDAPTGGYVLAVLLTVAILCGAVAALGLQPRDPIAEQLRRDHQSDRGVVGRHP
jgi:hypothetical protein